MLLRYAEFEVYDMIYRLPEANDKAMLHEYIQEHYDNRDVAGFWQSAVERLSLFPNGNPD